MDNSDKNSSEINENKYKELVDKYEELKIKYKSLHEQFVKTMSKNRDLLSQLEKVNKSNFFEIQLNEAHFLDIGSFKGTVTILDQTNDFIKYKTKQKKIYYCNKTNIKFIGIIEDNK